MKLTYAAILMTALVARAEALGTIDGTVVGPAGVANVHVSITCGAVHKNVALDGSGHFTITGLPEGSCTLVSSGAGLQTISMAITVSASAIATVLVTMTPPLPPPEPMPPMAMPVEAAAPRHRAPQPTPAVMPPAPPPPPPPPRLDAKVVRPVMHARARLEKVGGEMVAQQVAEYAPVRVFPVPQYTKPFDGPREDFRETVYWNGGVETDDQGNAEVTFVVSDAVTSFRATAEGISASGTPGRGRVAVQSKLPLNLDAHLPVEVTAGDDLALPITITNASDEALDAELVAKFGTAFQLADKPAGNLHLAPGEKRTVSYALHVTGAGTATVDLAVTANGLADKLAKTIRVVPLGFPFELSAAGTASKDHVARHDFALANALLGSIQATVTMYPSPLATMTKGMEGMIREPGGCFEQASSSNYPNIMILGYLGASDHPDPALVDKTRGILDHGYQLLTGYETPEKGYEWFGRTPGHEALTAYGLMEFADMAKVYDVDRTMVERTAAWLMARRDHKGGFERSHEALDSFGAAGTDTTNAYIMWALASAGRTAGLDQELAAQHALAETTRDPYLLALATNTALITKAKDAPLARLVAMQAKDGSFPGAKESITKSGGESLVVETTALAMLAMLHAPQGLDAQIRRTADFLDAKRSGFGGWENTQATILGLKALTAYADFGKQTQASGTATLKINGKPAGTIAFAKGRREALVWDDLAPLLAAGTNTVELELAGDAQLPYSIAISYRAARPQSSERAQVAVTTELATASVKMGEGVKLIAHVENRTKQGIPMTLARIGIPGGAVFQTWQLKELRDKGVIDFYETRPREVIVYWRALAPSVKRDVELDLLAAVPGTYVAPASSAYLYYTAEDKAWTAPVKLTITR